MFRNIFYKLIFKSTKQRIKMFIYIIILINQTIILINTFKIIYLEFVPYKVNDHFKRIPEQGSELMHSIFGFSYPELT